VTGLRFTQRSITGGPGVYTGWIVKAKKHVGNISVILDLADPASAPSVSHLVMSLGVLGCDTSYIAAVASGNP
jgi:hypothetical protein